MAVRRKAAVLLVVAVVGSACGTDAAFVGHGRQDSWQRVARPTFDAGTSHTIEGLAAPGDGYAWWTAVGSIRGQQGRTTPVAWSSSDGTHWGPSGLDLGEARESVASAAAIRQGVAVAVGTAITPVGDRDARIWSSRNGAIWTAVPLPGAPGDQTITSVAAGPLGFVAAGLDRSVPAVWMSPDGSTWTRVAEGSVFVGEQRILGVAVGRVGAVAVGTTDTSGNVDGITWFSADGVTWRTAPVGGPAALTGRGAQSVNSVTATDSGFVAVGEDAEGDRRVAVAWTSSDGLLWQRQLQSSEMAEYPGAESTQGVSARAIAGSGPVIAVGGGHRLQVWTSVDGRRWSRDLPPVQGAGSEEGVLVATDRRAVLVRPGGAGLWMRQPGGPWVDVGSDSAAFPRLTSVASVGPMVPAGRGLLVYGSDGDGKETMWRSPDGRTWNAQRLPDGLLDGGRIDELAVFADMVVAVGTANHPTAAGSNVAAVWASSDAGATWERVAAADPAFFVRDATQMFAVTAGGPGVVAVGLSYDVHATIDAHAWVSADGRTWRRAADPPAWSGPGDQYFTAVCALPGGAVVALGVTVDRGEQDVWAWMSPDGIMWEPAGANGGAVLRGEGLQYTADCASTPSGVLAAGREPGPGGRDGVLWGTTDGLSWTRVGPPGAFSSPKEDALVNVAAEGDRIIVTGSEDDDMTVYSSSDGGATWTKRTAATFGGFGSQAGNHVVLASDRAVITGVDGPSAAVWVGPAP